MLINNSLTPPAAVMTVCWGTQSKGYKCLADMAGDDLYIMGVGAGGRNYMQELKYRNLKVSHHTTSNYCFSVRTYTYVLNSMLKTDN